MNKYEKNDNPFENIRKMFPISTSINNLKLVIKEASVDDLEELREKNAFDRELMTCRPILERTRDGYIKLFTDLLTNRNNLLLGIYYDSGHKLQVIGRLSFYDYNSRNESVEMGYLLANRWQGNGIMSTCMMKLLGMLLDHGRLNKIYAQTCETNMNSRKLLEKCGFCIDAKLRKHHEYRGKYYDDYVYSILKEELASMEVRG